MSFRILITSIYWVMGLALIVWSNLTAGLLGPEAGVAPLLVLNFLTFPISLPLNFLFAFIGPLLWPNGLPVIVGVVMEFFILAAGYGQWFYFFPYLFRKLRDVFLNNFI